MRLARPASALFFALAIPSTIAALGACRGTQNAPCTDFDCSGHGKCTLVAPSAGAATVPTCQCDSGYSPSDSGWLCLPKDDTSLCAGVTCSGQGTCVSAAGKPRCVCNATTTLGADGTSCVDPCADQKCSGHGLCTVDPIAHAALCGCDPGYRATPDGLTCEATGTSDALLTWVLTSTDRPDSGTFGHMSLDVSQQASGQFVETQSLDYYVLGAKIRAVYQLDSSGNGLSSLTFDELASEGNVGRRRAGKATVNASSVALSYQRAGQEATVSLPIASGAAAPLPMLGGYDNPGWTLGCFSPVFFRLALANYDTKSKGEQVIDAFVPEAGLIQHIKVVDDSTFTDAKPVLSFPDYHTVVVYNKDGWPETITLPDEGVVWTLTEATPAALNLSALPPATPFSPTAPPSGAVETTVTFASADTTQLAGTLAMPPATTTASAPYPAVLLVADMRGADRDTPYADLPSSALYRHLAAYLADAGYASLRYDPRGKGDSAAGTAPPSLTAFRDDARAALTALAGAANIDTSRLYLLSLGAGSTIAIDLLAAGDGKGASVKGYVALAPLINDPTAALLYNASAHMIAAGFGGMFISHQTKSLNDDMKAIVDGTFSGTEWRDLPVAMWKELLTYDGAATLVAFSGPVLVLAGEEDLVMPAEQAQAAVDAATGANKANLTSTALAGVTYTLAAGKKDDLWETALLPFAVDSSAVSALVNWLKAN